MENNVYRFDGPYDEDESVHVSATSYVAALEKWRSKRAEDNELEPDEVEEPSNISLVSRGLVE